MGIRYFIDIDIFRNLLIDIDIDIDIFQNLLIDIDIDIDIFQNSPIDIDIDIDIFQNSLIDIDIDIDTFTMALSISISISIFSKFADISTIDINIRYFIHKSGQKTPEWAENRQKLSDFAPILHHYHINIFMIPLSISIYR